MKNVEKLLHQMRMELQIYKGIYNVADINMIPNQLDKEICRAILSFIEDLKNL